MNDRNMWRSGLVSLPMWRRKGKKHATKRKGNNPTLASDKKRKVDEASLERSSPGESDYFLTLMKLKALGM